MPAKKTTPKPQTKSPKAAAPRRGIRSTEFWLAAATSILSLLVLGGVIDLEGASTLDKVAGLAAAALASVGYSVSRGIAKHQNPPSE